MVRPQPAVRRVAPTAPGGNGAGAYARGGAPGRVEQGLVNLLATAVEFPRVAYSLDPVTAWPCFGPQPSALGISRSGLLRRRSIPASAR